MTAISIIIIILSVLLGLVVLAQNPKGGGLAAGFTGAQQIGGVQRTADFMEKATWTLATAVMVLCLVSASIQGSGTASDNLDAPIVLDENPQASEAVVPQDSEKVAPITPQPVQVPGGN